MYTYGQRQSPAQLLEKKMDSLVTLINKFKSVKADSTILRVDKLEEIFKKSEQGWFEKYIASIIALTTVAVSSGVAMYVGIRNSRTQLAIAAEQMQITRNQIEQNTRNTLAQIRSNNISKARIEWIESLRPILSDLFVNTFEAWHNLKQLLDAKTKNNQQATINFFKTYETLAFKIQSQKNQVELYLNPANETHQKLIQSMEEYINAFLDANNTIPDADMYKLSGAVIDNSRAVLKAAWEKAKSEVNV